MTSPMTRDTVRRYARRHRRRGRTRRPRLRDRGAAPRPVGARHRQGHAGQLHRRISRADGVLLDARADRDRRLSVSGAAATSRRARKRSSTTAASPRARRSTVGSTSACASARQPRRLHVVTVERRASRAARRGRDRLLRPAEPLDVPGEDLPKVTHYYAEPYRYVGRRSRSSARRNSAAKAALDCYRHGARGHARGACGRRCPTRSSTGSSRTSRTASRKAASARSSIRPSKRSAKTRSCCARRRGRARSRTTGCSR